MKKLVIAVLMFGGSLLAEVPLDTPLTKGGLMISVRPFEVAGAPVNSLQTFLHTSDPETYKFKVTAVVVLAGGKEEVVRGSVSPYPANVPGAFWTVLNLPTVGTPEKVLSVTVEEFKAPKNTDFR